MRVRMVAATVLITTSMVVTGCADDDDPTPTASGTVSAAPTTSDRTPESTVAAPLIAIDTPPEDSQVSAPIELSGTANTFEAALTVDVLDTAGALLCVRHIMATSGSGTPGTWGTTLAVPPPDQDEAVTVRAYELSAMDGSIINLVERSVTLSAERPPLFITSPACGASIAPGSTLLVEGRGVVFEGAFVLELRNAAGAVAATERGMAGGTEEMPFSVSMSVPAGLPNGFYDLVAFNYSAADGAIQNEFPVQVVVSP